MHSHFLQHQFSFGVCVLNIVFIIISHTMYTFHAAKQRQLSVWFVCCLLFYACMRTCVHIQVLAYEQIKVHAYILNRRNFKATMHVNALEHFFFKFPLWNQLCIASCRASSAQNQWWWWCRSFSCICMAPYIVEKIKVLEKKKLSKKWNLTLWPEKCFFY